MILVVDDDIGIRESLDIILSSEGYDVICAVDGSDALIKLTNSNPAVILLDIMMVPMDGLEFLARLREKGLQGKYPIIIMTAMFNIEDDLRKLQSSGEILNFVSKPLDPLDNFLQLIQNIEKLHTNQENNQ
jgi:two-component system response regulator VicR